MSKTKKWFWAALFISVAAAPNALLLKEALVNVDPFLLNALRAVPALVCLPWMIQALPRLKGAARRYVLYMSFGFSTASITYVLAIQQSSASFVSILLLLSPIALIWLAVRLTNERVKSHQIVGITLAAAGVCIVLCAPLASSDTAVQMFFPLATVLALIEVVTFPLATIYGKKAHTYGRIPMPALVGYASFTALIVNCILWLVTGASWPGDRLWHGDVVLPILYSGIVVGIIARLVSVKAYTYIGAVATGSLSYIETLLAIVLPLLILHEKLSIFTVAGGCVMLLGVVVAERHRSQHLKHYHSLRHR